MKQLLCIVSFRFFVESFMSKPTILFMNRAYPPMRGATGRLLQDLAKEFVRANWQVTIVTSGRTSGVEHDGDLRIIRVKGTQRPRNMFSYIWIWIKMFIVAMRVSRYDLLVSMSDPPLIIIAGTIISKFKKSRHINWCQDIYPDVMPALGMKLPKFLMNWLVSLRVLAMKQCDMVIVCGRCMAKHLRHEGVTIKVIPNWADIELIHPDKLGVAREKQKEINIDIARPFEKQLKKDKHFRVLYSGNMGLAHSVETILMAAKVLQEQESDIEFVFVGDGDRFDYIAEQRSFMGLTNISLLPYQPVSNLREVMESGDIHLITMKDDAAGFIVPCKLYSALAVARPCIFVGPDDTEISIVINEFKSGYVVAQGDTENLVNALKHLRNNSDAWFDAHRGALEARDVFIPNISMHEFILNADNVLNSKII